MEARPFSDIAFEEFLNEENLMGSRCAKCGAVFVPPRSICITCYSTDMQWVEMQGKGRLAAFTCTSIAPPFMIEQGYSRKNPYCSGVVELEEGGRVDILVNNAGIVRDSLLVKLKDGQLIHQMPEADFDLVVSITLPVPPVRPKVRCMSTGRFWGTCRASNSPTIFFRRKVIFSGPRRTGPGSAG